MSSIKYETDQTFPFPELHLANPTGLQGGAYFSKLKLGEKKVFIQMPKCETKNGIHRTGKKIYTDLMFKTSNEAFDEWVHNLSTRVKSLIYDKKDIWFQNEMTYDDIEYHWQNILRTYKKNYVLLRCIIKKPRNINRKELVMVYDEDENIISLDGIKSDSSIIPLLEITGLKFTSQSFLLEFALKQVMVLNETDGSECLISVAKSSPTTNTEIQNIAASIQTTTKSKTSSENSAEQDDSLEIDHTLNKNIESEKFIEQSLLELNKQISLGNLEIIKEKKTNESMSDREVVKTPDNGENKENIVLEIKPFVKSDDDINKGDKAEYLEKSVYDDSRGGDKNVNSNTLEKKAINEVKLEYPDTGDIIALKKPDEVYLAIYKEAKRKATEAKRAAIQAYLEVKRIKNKYMLDEVESSDDEYEMPTYE